MTLDNHSAHLSKETRAYLATRTNRFKYVLTPVNGSWLNIVETLFGRMARTFLKQIRVQTKEKPRQRILKGVEEINQMPVAYRIVPRPTLQFQTSSAIIAITKGPVQ